jgi:hypothetical protein
MFKKIICVFCLSLLVGCATRGTQISAQSDDILGEPKDEKASPVQIKAVSVKWAGLRATEFSTNVLEDRKIPGFNNFSDTEIKSMSNVAVYKDGDNEYAVVLTKDTNEYKIKTISHTGPTSTFVLSDPINSDFKTQIYLYKTKDDDVLVFYALNEKLCQRSLIKTSNTETCVTVNKDKPAINYKAVQFVSSDNTLYINTNTGLYSGALPLTNTSELKKIHAHTIDVSPKLPMVVSKSNLFVNIGDEIIKYSLLNNSLLETVDIRTDTPDEASNETVGSMVGDKNGGLHYTVIYNTNDTDSIPDLPSTLTIIKQFNTNRSCGDLENYIYRWSAQTGDSVDCADKQKNGGFNSVDGVTALAYDTLNQALLIPAPLSNEHFIDKLSYSYKNHSGDLKTVTGLDIGDVTKNILEKNRFVFNLSQQNKLAGEDGNSRTKNQYVIKTDNVSSKPIYSLVLGNNEKIFELMKQNSREDTYTKFKKLIPRIDAIYPMTKIYIKGKDNTSLNLHLNPNLSEDRYFNHMYNIGEDGHDHDQRIRHSSSNTLHLTESGISNPIEHVAIGEEYIYLVDDQGNLYISN